MLVFSLVSVLGPFSCYFAGLQHLEPTRAIVASCLEPVFSILIAALVLGELCGRCRRSESFWCWWRLC
jgi:drug/metabolite transporter (DMT)-like permease